MTRVVGGSRECRACISGRGGEVSRVASVHARRTSQIRPHGPRCVPPHVFRGTYARLILFFAPSPLTWRPSLSLQSPSSLTNCLSVVIVLIQSHANLRHEQMLKATTG